MPQNDVEKKLMKKLIASFIIVLLSTVASFAEISVTPFGAAQTVSGSCFLFESGGKKIVIDCGLFMEGDDSLNLMLPDEIIKADVLVLTHAHQDHSGRIPLLIAKGFKGKIYSTAATKDIFLTLVENGEGLDLIERQWFWSASQIQKGRDFGNTVVIHWRPECESNIKTIERSSVAMSLSAAETEQGVSFSLCKVCAANEANDICKRFVTLSYGVQTEIAKGIKIKFYNAAHIPGSASVLFTAENKKILFSGDLGSGYSKLTGMFEVPDRADGIFMESTYADKTAGISQADYDVFRKDLLDAVASSKTVWIPALSLNRTQKVLYEIKQMQDGGLIAKDYPIYSVSPSANSITELYKKEVANGSGTWFVKDVYKNGIVGPNTRLQPVRDYTTPRIVISASGDMNYGMSEKMLPKFLPNKDVNIMIVNFVSPSSNAGRLLAGKPDKNGIILAGTIKKYDIFSDHPDFNMLLQWLAKQNKSVKIYLIHSEPETLNKMVELMSSAGWTGVSAAKLKETVKF